MSVNRTGGVVACFPPLSVPSLHSAGCSSLPRYATSGGGLVPQELINLVIEQSCPVRDKGSSCQNKILGPEVNLPF